MKALGALLIIVGFLFSLSGIGALIGIPLIIGGIVSFFYPIFAAVVLVGTVFGYEAGAQTSGGYVFAILVAAAILLPLKHFVFDKLEKEDPLKSLIFGETDIPKQNSENKPQSRSSASENNDHWEMALNEVNDENSRIPSLWARAFAESLGDDKKAAAIYIKLRVENLSEKFSDTLPEQYTQKGIKAEVAELYRRGEYTVSTIEDVHCMVFPNSIHGIDLGDSLRLYDSEENATKSILHKKKSSMFLTTGHVETIRKSDLS